MRLTDALALAGILAIFGLCAWTLYDHEVTAERRCETVVESICGAGREGTCRFKLANGRYASAHHPLLPGERYCWKVYP
jgi:hypothetical protein